MRTALLRAFCVLALCPLGCGGQVESISHASATPDDSSKPDPSPGTSGSPSVHKPPDDPPECSCPDALPCFTTGCDDTGACVVIAASAGTSCSDANPCSVGDSCDGSGVCVAGGARTFDEVYGDAAAGAWRAVLPLEGGRIAVAGHTGWHQGTTGYDAWFALTDSGGNLLSEHTWAGDGDEYAMRIVRTDDRGFLLVGSSSSAGSSAQPWLTRLDANGEPLWTTTLSLSTSVEIEAATALDDGSFAIGGGLIENGRITDAWIGVLDPAGQLVTQMTYETSRSDCVTNMVAIEGDIVVSGYSRNFATERYDAWVSRFHKDGSAVFQHTLEQDLLLAVSDLAALSDGSVAVLLDVSKASESTVELHKVTGDGELIWSASRALPGSIDAPSQLTIGADGNLVVVGGTFTPSFTGFELSFLRVDSVNGESLADATLAFDTEHYPRPYDVVASDEGTFLIAGTQWVASGSSGWSAGYAELSRVDPWPPASCGISAQLWSR
ncbi:MAG: hypothetical protein U0165_10260 [Polyangiaceae bacterium]